MTLNREQFILSLHIDILNRKFNYITIDGLWPYVIRPKRKQTNLSKQTSVYTLYPEGGMAWNFP